MLCRRLHPQITQHIETLTRVEVDCRPLAEIVESQARALSSLMVLNHYGFRPNPVAHVSYHPTDETSGSGAL